MGIEGEEGKEGKDGKELIINRSNQCLEKFGENKRRNLLENVCLSKLENYVGLSLILINF